jgi:opacity protein-like surface antigen
MRTNLWVRGISREAKVKIAATIITALVGMFAGSQVHAQSSGGYLGISGGAVWTDAAGSVAEFGSGIHDESVPNGFKVYGGRIWDGFGIEFAYYNLGEYDIEDGAGAVQDRLETRALAVSGVYSAPLGHGYALIARLGIAFTEARYDCRLDCGPPFFVDTKRRGNAGLIGLGFASQISGNIGLRMEFEHIGNVRHGISNAFLFNEGYDMFSVGIHVNF